MCLVWCRSVEQLGVDKGGSVGTGQVIFTGGTPCPWSSGLDRCWVSLVWLPMVSGSPRMRILEAKAVSEEFSSEFCTWIGDRHQHTYEYIYIRA